jgi:hypothetical protein
VSMIAVFQAPGESMPGAALTLSDRAKIFSPQAVSASDGPRVAVLQNCPGTMARPAKLLAFEQMNAGFQPALAPIVYSKLRFPLCAIPKRPASILAVFT